MTEGKRTKLQRATARKSDSTGVEPATFNRQAKDLAARPPQPHAQFVGSKHHNSSPSELNWPSADVESLENVTDQHTGGR